MASQKSEKSRTRSHTHHTGRKIQKKFDPKTKRKSRLANMGAVVFGAGGVAAASMIGVGELAVGAFVAYVAYRIIRYGVAPTEAILEGVQLEHGEVPKTKANVA